MNQQKYNELCEKVEKYKRLNFSGLESKILLNNYISKVEKLLNDEYKYGSSWIDIYYLTKYMNKCKQIYIKET